jgi:hypothetical protein
VAGFVYPGKGHEEVIRAAARQPSAPAVIAMGAASAGHTDLVADLRQLASRLGVRFEVTGPLTDPQMAEALAAVAVPLVPARRVSASGSLMSWLAAGRRPLVAAGAYAREVAELCPGAVHLYEPGELDSLVARALMDPPFSRITEPLGWPDVGQMHRDAYQAALSC